MHTVTVDSRVGARLQRLRENLKSVIRGKDETIEDVIVALVAGGSVLIEDVPGVGKTTLAKALAASVDLEFQRVQCTPDLLPADLVGFSVFNPRNGGFDPSVADFSRTMALRGRRYQTVPVIFRENVDLTLCEI